MNFSRVWFSGVQISKPGVGKLTMIDPRPLLEPRTDEFRWPASSGKPVITTVYLLGVGAGLWEGCDFFWRQPPLAALLSPWLRCVQLFCTSLPPLPCSGWAATCVESSISPSLLRGCALCSVLCNGAERNCRIAAFIRLENDNESIWPI